MILSYIILALYALALGLIFLYALAQLNLLFNYIRSEKQKKSEDLFDLKHQDEIPNVTIQLPVYNELYVMERLLDNIANIDYPRDKLEIQVLDDSTDESLEQTAQHIARLKKTGIDIKHVLRDNREGFKAGALK